MAGLGLRTLIRPGFVALMLLALLAYAYSDPEESDSALLRVARSGHFGRYRNLHQRRPIHTPQKYQPKPHPHNPYRRVSHVPVSTSGGSPNKHHYADEVDANGYAAILG